MMKRKLLALVLICSLLMPAVLSACAKEEEDSGRSSKKKYENSEKEKDDSKKEKDDSKEEKGDPQKDDSSESGGNSEASELEKKLSGLSAGSEVELGVYDTDDDTNTENESLSWIVLDETKEAVLLISKYPYMKLRYMEIPENRDDELKELNWAVSELRETINSDDFINSMFTPEERERILTTHIASGGDEYFDRDGGPDTDDRLFIPDSTEIETYYPEESSRGFEDTSYWLRTASFVVPFMKKVSMTGSYSDGEAYELSGVRLMMWVKKGSYKPSAGDLEDPSKPSGSDDKTASSDTTENSQENSGQDKEQGGSGSGSSGGRTSSGNGSSEREGREYADGLKSNLETPEVGAQYHFASVEAAKPALEAGLAEYRAYLKGDTNGQYTKQIENRYINHYLIPYLEVLQQNQLLIDPDSVDSKWFSEENTSMSDKVAGGSYENIYKKYAQDMIPYMLPDPDVMLHNVLGVFKSHGMTTDPEDKQINAAKILEAYNNYDPKWYESNWSTDWQKLNRDFHYCYSGDAYRASGDGISASISFTSPKYNERYYINANVFGTEDDENFMTIAPWSNATSLLSEIQTIRDVAPADFEVYIQEISVAVTAPDRGTASEIIREAFAEINPYNSASGRAAILAATSDIIWVPQGSEDYSTGERVIEWEMAPVYQGHEEKLRYDPALEYFVEQDYTPTYSPLPLFNLTTVNRNPYNQAYTNGYMTEAIDSYFNHTCDQHVDYRLDTSSSSEGVTMILTIRYAGPTANALNERKYMEGGGRSMVDMYGLYYPLVLPIYFNEAAKNGFFTPYKIPKVREDENLGSLIPDYSGNRKIYSEDNPYVSMTEQESDIEKMTRWFNEGFREEEKHNFPPHMSRDKVDLTKQGYTKNADGTYTREMEVSQKDGIQNVKRHILTYDETGLLISGYKEFTDGSTRYINYQTDWKGNPLHSVDRYYDAAGNLTAQVYVSYASDGSATEKAFYSTEVRENSGGYVKLESATYDKSGNVTGWTRYNENGSPRYSKSTTSWVDESANTIGGKKTYTEHTIVTETEYDEYGNVVSENQQEFIAVRDRSDYNERKNALQKYLEEKTGVTRGSDWP